MLGCVVQRFLPEQVWVVLEFFSLQHKNARIQYLGSTQRIQNNTNE
jgi:hypothetical protein